MPQPFPADNFIYSHKGLPKDNYPLHHNDLRYNLQIYNWPRRHYVPVFKFKIYNFNDLDAMMHMMQWNDMTLDYQTEDPMDSNHYIENRSPMFLGIMVIFGFIFIVCYAVWGYALIDWVEDPYRMRKIFYPASFGFQLFRINPFEDGYNNDLPKSRIDRDPVLRFDKDGNALPSTIRRYPFADEYTYRI